MIEITLIFVGLVPAVRCLTLGKLTIGDFPGANAAKFFEWQAAALMANDIYLCVTWGAATLKIVLSFVLWQMGLTDDGLLTAFLAGLVAWLGGLTVAAIYGSKARRRRTALFASPNETQPRRSTPVVTEPSIVPPRRKTRRTPHQLPAKKTSASAVRLPSGSEEATSAPVAVMPESVAAASAEIDAPRCAPKPR